MLPSTLLMAISPPIVVTPGSAEYNSAGAGSQVLPNFNTLVVELWGAGSSGNGLTPPSTNFPGNDGGTTTCSTLGLTAGGGVRPSGAPANPGAGGLASGGDINTSGSQGVAGGAYNGVFGRGGSSPNGGATTLPPAGQGTPGLADNGFNGAAPGAAGSAPTYNVSGSQFSGCGGSGGAYCRKTYTRGSPGAPAIGDTINHIVGGGGARDAAANFDGGSGANGRIRYTWS